MKKLLWIPLFCLFLTCSDDDNPGNEDMTNPNLSITSGLSEGDELMGTVTIQFSANDDSGIGAVNVVLDGTETFTLESPYAWTFETSSYPDGPHGISAQAVDLKGNQSAELNVQFTIENTFLTVTVGDNFLGTSSDYLIISNDQNQVVDFAELEDGRSYEFQRSPGFNQSDYNYHLIEIVDNRSFSMNTTLDETTDQITLERTNSASFDVGVELGNAEINFVNVPRHDYFFFYPAQALYQDLNLTGLTFQATLNENTSNYYLYLIDGTQGYFMEGSLQVGQNTLDLSNLSNDMESFNLSVEPDISSFTVVARDHSKQDRVIPYMLAFFGPIWQGQENQITFHLPRDRSNLDNYYITSSYSSGTFDGGWSSSSFSENDLLLPQLMEATIESATFQGDDITLNVSGTFDNGRIATINRDGNDQFLWAINLKEGGQYPDLFPQIPGEIIDAFPKFLRERFLHNGGGFLTRISEEVKTSTTQEQRSFQRDFE